jgi:hypothetical protein
LLGNADLCAGDDWTGQAGSEQVATFVGGIALYGTEAELLDKLLLQIKNDHLQRTDLERLFLNLVPGLLLANIGKEAHHLVSFLFTSC